jgi:hypothetical protein
MWTAALALLCVIGAWHAWRRNPAYSGRSTLRLVGVTALAIIALMSVIVAVVNLTMDRPPVVAMSAMFAVVVLGALGMIFIIQYVSTPKSARLTTEVPASATLVNVYRRKVYKLAKFFAILLAIVAVLALLIPEPARFAVLALGAIALLLALVLLPVMYVTNRNFDRALTALECNPWAHWQYTPAQWQQWTDVRVARMKATPPTFVPQRDWRKIAVPLALIVVVLLAFGPGSLPVRALYGFGGCAVILGLFVLGVRGDQHSADRLRAAMQGAAPEVYFGHDGVFCEGVLTTWLTMDNYLKAASIDAREPRSLLFRFEKVVVNPYGGNQLVPIYQSVLIPEGAQADLARLQHELSARFPDLPIALAP